MEAAKVLRLKPEYREAIANSITIQAEISKACNKSNATILRWVRINAEQLTMLSVLNVLRKELKLEKSSELTEWIDEPVKAAA